MHYYVNRAPQPNGDHEVHTIECASLPNEINRLYLGEFGNCDGAVEAARRHVPQVTGCAHCSEPCHTS